MNTRRQGHLVPSWKLPSLPWLGLSLFLIPSSFALVMPSIALVIILPVFNSSQIYPARLGLSSDLYNLFIWHIHLAFSQVLKINVLQMKCFILPFHRFQIFFLCSAKLFGLGKWQLHHTVSQARQEDIFLDLYFHCLPHRSITTLPSSVTSKLLSPGCPKEPLDMFASIFALLQPILTNKID